MNLIDVMFLSVLQGLTEFLPVSSSGHIVIASTLAEKAGHQLPDKLALNVFLHLGTLGAIVVVYRRRLWRLLGPDVRVALRIAVAAIPAAFVGLLFKDQIEQVFEGPMLAGGMLLVTGALLVVSMRFPGGAITCDRLPYWKALLIGVFQAIAILPGISRSGATIVAALICGMDREEAAAFSFLMAVPVIAGAGLLESLDLLQQPDTGNSWGLLLLAAAGALVSGLAALLWLLGWVRRGRLHWFAWWVFPLGIAVLTWQLMFA